MPNFEPVPSGALPPSYKFRKGTRISHPTRMASHQSNDLSKAEDPNAGTSMSADTFKAETAARYFNGFFQGILGLSTLGASVTFSFVLTSSTTLDSLPSNTAYVYRRSLKPTIWRTREMVSRFIAISWLLFILAIAFSSILNTLLQFYHDDALVWWSRGGRDKRIILWYASLASSLLYALIIAAFTLLCLVVAAFQPAVGWVALGFTAFLGVAGLLSIALRTPLGLLWLSHRLLRGFGKKQSQGEGIIGTPDTGTTRRSRRRSVGEDEDWQDENEESRHKGIEQENVV